MTDETFDGGDHLVVTGSSAGGIEALTMLVGSLPRDFPAPVVIAQHLDPNAQSVLPQILARHTTLPVKLIEKKEPLRPGNIYVVPANKHVSVTDHEVTVSTTGPSGLRPSVDLLFNTAASTFEDRLIAVILSGMGSDGAVGARMVKKHGGTVIIQDPETSLYPSMPMALPRTSVDIVARAENIGPLLKDLISGTYLPSESEEQAAVRDLLRQVRDSSGIDFSNYKRSTILRRLSRLMASTGCETLTQYLEYLKKNPEAYQRLISGFLIKVTEFFRDPEVFDELRRVVLPGLAAEARAHNRELRLWSAGCATGEEAYTLAILIAELLSDGEPIPARIFATDIDGDAIGFARHGMYSSDVLEGMEDSLIERYFTPLDGAYEVKKHIRSMVVFGQHDLGQRAPFPRVDLALCRNVLIYFTKELQQRALHLFAYSLRPGGFLALGKSETATPLPDYFEPVQSTVKLYRRRGDRVPLMVSETKSAYVLPRPYRAVMPSFTHLPSLQTQARSTAAEQLGTHLMRAPIGLAVIDRRYDIRLINNAGRDMFNIRTVGVGEDLLHLLPPDASATLRPIIDGTFKNELIDTVGTELTIRGDAGDDRFLRIWAFHGERTESGVAQTASLLAIDVTAEVNLQRGLERSSTRQQKAIDEMSSEKTELLARQRALIEANSELSRANADLLANNERLILSVEEAESSTEEIETLNEEMQATNEELETLNEELQATIEELNTTNDELEARTIELQSAAVSREAERQISEARREELTGVLDAIPDAICYFEKSGAIGFSNQTYRDFAERIEKGKASMSIDGRKVDLAAIARRLETTSPISLDIALADVAAKSAPLKGAAVRREGGRGLLVIYSLPPL
jgi:two-component system, chemotaxis family, CheB/CheR fusion protein